MISGLTVFSTAIDENSVFDSSSNGIGIKKTTNAKINTKIRGIEFRNGAIQFHHNQTLESINEFTVELTFIVKTLTRQNQTIFESPELGLTLSVNPVGALIIEVHSARPINISSEPTRIQAGKKTIIRMAYDNKKFTLWINRKKVKTQIIREKIVHDTKKGIVMGASDGGSKNQLDGTIYELSIYSGVISESAVKKRVADAKNLANKIRQNAGLVNVIVNNSPDYSHHRLQNVKAMMNIAGVEKLSDLATLKMNSTLIESNRIYAAPAASSYNGGYSTDWTQVVSQFNLGNVAERRKLIARYLPNRNSASELQKLQPGGPAVIPVTGAPAPTDVHPATTNDISHTISTRRTSTASILSHPRLTTSDMFRTDISGTHLTNTAIINELKGNDPTNWPTMTPPSVLYSYPVNILVDEAVIIAHTLDIRNTVLTIKPEVKTLWIIAEKVICDSKSKITWQKTSRSVPAIANNNALNGTNVYDVGNPDGRDGGNGKSGICGDDGYDGLNAPNLQLWTLQMNSIPKIDLSGEDGIQGGRGQKGGNGGKGGNGAHGKWMWLVVPFCVSRAGNGGDGGRGGNGGRGGQGGNGGNNGDITIAVEDSLLDTITNGPMVIVNSGGGKGLGGTGGSGGNGGAGGRSGAGTYCRDAKAGKTGAIGQNGATGYTGLRKGNLGQMEFLEISKEAWEDILNRPWIVNINPDYAFPGDKITISGSPFTDNDRVKIDSTSLVPTVNADESISVTIPLSIAGGEKTVYVVRQDGTESNRLRIWIKPSLDVLPANEFEGGATFEITGNAFLNGAGVLINGSSYPATYINKSKLSVTLPGSSGQGLAGGTINMQVVNPDGLKSNTRTFEIIATLSIPFIYNQHNLTFSNFDIGAPSWDTYKDTFGASEVMFELLTPFFGHPILTVAYYLFYEEYLKGKGNGGLATGFCSAMSSLVADRFWRNLSGTTSLTLNPLRSQLTAIHGKILSRESLLTFHDQGLQGVSRIERTYHEIESTFMRGCDRDNMPLIFFIPSGNVWDAGYIDKLGESHCVMPYKFVYPAGRVPTLSADGTFTITNADQVKLYVWDCNHPTNDNCYILFKRSGGQIHFEFHPDSASADLESSDGFTLGMMRHGNYMLADHSLPFSGPFGLTSFVIDFLLSPCDLQVKDANNLRTGNFNGQIYAEIPNSHPAYLAKGMYLLPVNTPLIKEIKGNKAGTYSYQSILPEGGTFTLSHITTDVGQVDTVSTNADGSQIRITPQTSKTFDLSISRLVNDQVRAVEIRNLGGAPNKEVDITISPDLSMLRIGNREVDRVVDVDAYMREPSQPEQIKHITNFNLPTNNDLVIVSDWTTMSIQPEALPFN